jgi:hypothetical protein
MGKEEKRHSIGTDPEFFIIHKEGGKPVNAEKMFPGTKNEPHPMKSGSGLQTDNVAVEFASIAAKDADELVHNIRETFKEIKQMIPEHLEIDASPSAIFDEEELKTEQAQKFGCDPSYCAWELKENDQPDASNTNMRSTGGHIHVGTVEGDGNGFLLDPYGKVDTVRTMDAFHGIISVTLDTTAASVERRKLYGSAGEHRPKDYGIEYRTLSSFWLKSPSLVMLMDSLTTDVLNLVRDDKHKDIIESIGSDAIRSIINEGKQLEAKKVIDSVLIGHLSENSKHFLKECSANIDKYVLAVEWNI